MIFCKFYICFFIPSLIRVLRFQCCEVSKLSPSFGWSACSTCNICNYLKAKLFFHVSAYWQIKLLFFQQILKSAELIGYFVEAEVWTALILEELSKSQCPSVLMVLAAIIKGCKQNQLKDHLLVVCDKLASPDLCYTTKVLSPFFTSEIYTYPEIEFHITYLLVKILKILKMNTHLVFKTSL